MSNSQLANHNLLGAPLPTRIEEIKTLRKSIKNSPTSPVKFRGETLHLTIYRVKLGFPKYRLGNGRTMTDQIQYIEENGKTTDYFDAAYQENDEVQESQHQLLVQRARTKSTDDLFTHFETNRNKQDDPLILENNGFVVNGNRRLATFRELFLKDPTEYDHFQHINIVLLPEGATNEDILALEAELQLKKDVKSDYDWADRAYMIRNSRLTLTDSKICDMFQIKTKELQDQIQQLELAEEYLVTIGYPKRYDRLTSQEEAYRSLRKSLDDKAILDSEAKRQLYKHIVFGLLNSPKSERVYDTIPDAKEALPEIIEKLAQDELINPSLIKDAVSELQAATVDDPLDELFGASQLLTPSELETENKIQALVNILQKPENEEFKKALTKATLDVIEDQREKKKIQRSEAEAFKLIDKANSLLASAVNVLDQQSKDKTLSIKAMLDNITDSIETIRKWADQS